MNIRLIAFSILVSLSTIAYPQEKSHFAKAKEGASKAASFVKKHWDWKVTAGVGAGLVVLGLAGSRYFHNQAFEIVLTHLKGTSVYQNENRDRGLEVANKEAVRRANSLVSIMQNSLINGPAIDPLRTANPIFLNNIFKSHCQKSVYGSAVALIGICIAAGALLYAGGTFIYNKINKKDQTKVPVIESEQISPVITK